MAVRRKNVAGYTLIELMAVLAIASALLVVAIPMFRTQIQNSHMSAAGTDLLSTFMSAKSEAVGRNYPVTVCIRNEDADGCAAEGDYDGEFGWEKGWLTFVNMNGNKTLDADEDILQNHAPLADTITVRTNNMDDLKYRIEYHPNGLTNLRETRRLIICNTLKQSGIYPRVLIVSMLGKVSILKADDAERAACPGA
jgi:type IV fimbrial biogenesis protein FimT